MQIEKPPKNPILLLIWTIKFVYLMFLFFFFKILLKLNSY